MKHLRKKRAVSRAVVSRIILSVLLLALIGGVLTACMSKPVYTLKPGTIEHTEQNHMTAGELDKLATDIAASKYAKDVHARLVAAYNGYDMYAEGFDDKLVGTNDPKAPVPHPEKAAEYALRVLEENNIEIFPFKDKMNRADVETLVKCFQTKVNTEAHLSMFGHILHWMALGLEWLIQYPGFGSFILGTLYFSIVVEIIMLPLGIHQQKNSLKAARLRPKEMAIRNKYKGRNDKATQQEVATEIQQMYANEGYNPMSGCLPLLISMPFMFALYYIVIDPMKYMMNVSTDVSYALASFVGAPKAAGGLGLTLTSSNGSIEVLSMIRENGVDLMEGIRNFSYFTNGEACFEALSDMGSRIPNFTLFGMNMGLTPSFGRIDWLLLIPVITFAVYFGSMKLTRKLTFQPMADAGQDAAQGCSNNIMDLMMPMMSVFFTFAVPAAIGIYWIFRSLVGTLKQFILYKAMPMPTFTEEEYKAAERELAGKEKHRPVKRSGHPNPNVRSLHHIDDEDYETALPEKTGGKNATVRPSPETPPEQPSSDQDKEAHEADPEVSDGKAEKKTRKGLFQGARLKEDDPKHDRKNQK